MWHIFGADGYIGRQLLDYLPDEIERICYSRKSIEGFKQFDLLQTDVFEFDNIGEGDFCVFLAAISSPDFCRDNEQTAYEVNVEGTEKFIAHLIDRKARVLFFSSDVVYGDTGNEILNESGRCLPGGNYARMKYGVESFFKNSPYFKVFRLSYVFSATDKFMKYLHSCAEKDYEAEVFETLHRSVIYIEDIFDAIVALSKKYEGFDNCIFNLSGPEVLSRKDMADIYKENINRCLRYKVIEPGKGFLDARPAEIRTKSLYLEKLLERKPTLISEAAKKEKVKMESR